MPLHRLAFLTHEGTGNATQRAAFQPTGVVARHL